ncbi:hypothetical protein OAN12_04270 [Halioglobus sp.]|nr:hypothetical protein [Halioglobus sp.]
MKDNTLTQPFRFKPGTRPQLNSAPACAVLSDVNANVISFAAGTAYGLVKDNCSAADTYMNMAEGA